MRVALVAFASVLVAACNGGGGGNPDADGDGPPTGDPSTLTCKQIQTALGERINAVSHQCTTRDDCIAVGYASRDGTYPTCDCAPFFSVGGAGCGGSGVNAQAWSADTRAQALLDEWETRCTVPGACGMSNICGCDCGLGELTCTNGFCNVALYNCFEPFPPDAMPDSSPSDASVD